MPQPRRDFLKSFSFAPSAYARLAYLFGEQLLAKSASEQEVFEQDTCKIWTSEVKRPSEQFANGATTILFAHRIDLEAEWSILCLG